MLSVVSVLSAAIWFVHSASHPVAKEYIVTPERYGRISTRGAMITAESWSGHDETNARGWLLRGASNAPAVVLLHRYGTDRSHVLDLGVKINEATNYTILMPDQRGHGANPDVKYTTFGGCEAEDVISAIQFLRGLKDDSGETLVGENVGIYGVEMGAMAAIAAAAKDQSVKALVLDSVLTSSDELLGMVMERDYPFASSVTTKIAELGTYPYFFSGCYDTDGVCEEAKAVEGRNVMLLAGSDSTMFGEAAVQVKRCFPTSTEVTIKTDLNPSGYNLTKASINQMAAYDQRVIAYFSSILGSDFRRPAPQTGSSEAD